MSVEVWGLLWCPQYGLHHRRPVVARVGLGPRPVRLIVVLNLVNWIVCSLFTIQASIVLLAVGCFVC